MKKAALLLLALVLALSLTACGKSEAAQAVDDMIAAIGEVTLDSEDLISEAEQAVENLGEEDRKQLDKTGDLEAARAAYEGLVLEQEIGEVQDAISSIGTVTLDSESAISSARSLYDSSSAEVQSGVDVTALEAAEAELNRLRVQEVIDLIDAIGDVTMEDAGRVEEAHKALDTLSESDAAKVTNRSALDAAEAELARLKEEVGKAALAKLKATEDKVQGITWYEPSEMPYYADTRSYVLPYIGKNSSNTWLRLRYHYTGDDWVFFKTITVLVDGERYYKLFNYFDIERDNEYGNVWEWIDEEPSDSDIEMLRAIAASNETIVRFEGDAHHYDLTVKASDKAAITTVLDAFEAAK